MKNQINAIVYEYGNHLEPLCISNYHGITMRYHHYITEVCLSNSSDNVLKLDKIRNIVLFKVYV